MKAVICAAYGPPETLALQQLAPAIAGAGETVVRVGAAALNFFDTLIIENRYQTKPALPFSPGAELAGTVTAVGPGVTGFAPGDRVMAFTGHGAAREEVVIGVDQLIPVPDGIDDAIAAGLIVTYGTTIHALKDRADLKRGETLAVLGASGGVGIAAVEIGKAMGARVIACASSQEKLAFARAHGADETINYAQEDLKERLKDLTDGRGADVIYDPVGGAYAEAALRATAWGGRFLVIGFAAGDIPRIPLNLVLLKGCALIGVFWGAFVARDPAAHRANTAQVLAWVKDGKLAPHIDRVCRLEETADALQAIARREVKGKVVIVP